ncbi:MAG: hypothetical protein ACFFAO_00695 [Candidatus Hermodarchaeota archaeon]
MILTFAEIINEIFSTMIVFIFVLVGLLTIRRYRKFQNQLYILWGIGLLGLGIPWLASSISFFMIITTGEGLTEVPYFFITLFPLAITSFFWMWTMTDLLIKEKQKFYLLIMVVTGVLFEIYLFYFLITDPSVIGILHNPPIDSTYYGITMLYMIFMMAVVSISLSIFIWQSFKLDNPEIKLKAKFLLAGLISFLFGSIFDGMFPLNVVYIMIMRLILFTSAIEFYIGWNLPESIKKFFIKE